MKSNFLKATLLVGLLVLSGCNNIGPGPDLGGDVQSEYVVTFKDWNDTILYETNVPIGEIAEYKGETPTRDSDGEYSYEFAGWDQDYTNIAIFEDMTFTATYKKTFIHVDNDYDETVKTWSQKGHLYIHYLRPKAETIEEYNDWAVWVWQKAPKDQEGTLWGATPEEMASKDGSIKAENLVTPVPEATSWMTNIGGTGRDIDQSGRIMDIDLNREGLHAGKFPNDPVTLKNITRLGFLIVKKDSMDGGTHWVSDGGADTFINQFDIELAKNGFIHLYAVQGSVGDYKLSWSEASNVKPNEVVTDTTGKFKSQGNIDSSTSNYGVSPTSKSFKQLGVGYQIFVPTFRDSNNDGMGDLRGIINSLDYLKALNVEVLWLTPVQESGSYHGYDVTDFYAVDPKFGTIDDYRELIYKAHEKGMKVLMDLVINHTSKNNVWFKKSQQNVTELDEFGNEINYRNMYHWKFEGDTYKAFDKTKRQLVQKKVEEPTDNPVWFKDGESKYYYFGKFGSGMAELNYDYQGTRDLVASMAKYWLGFGLDGFRLDAVKHIYMQDELDDARISDSDVIVPDYSDKTYYDDEMGKVNTIFQDYSSNVTKNVNFWKEFANELKKVDPDCFLVGENFDGWGNRIAPYYQALDSQFDFALFFHNYEHLYGLSQSNAQSITGTHYDETHGRFKAFNQDTIKAPTYDFDKSGKIDESEKVTVTLEGGKRPDFINSPFTSNHDTDRLINNMNRPANNKVTGTAQEIGHAKVGLASTILNPGISWIYYGDELGMSSNTDQHKALYQNENNMDIWYRQPFPWGTKENGLTNVTFGKYTIGFDEHNAQLQVSDTMEGIDNEIYDFTKELTRIKTTYLKGAELIRTDYNSKTQDEKNNLVDYIIKNNVGETYHVYINTGAIGNKEFHISGNIVEALNGATKAGNLPVYGVIVTRG